jgi:23S rRNA maturation-related 3'-5' exoribonuclease YhaM
MFVVEHAQQFRAFNNNAVYYKLHLKKYVQKSNVIAGNLAIQEKVQELTKNSTINELFGVENSQDKTSVANKEEFRPLTRDITRVSIAASITKELIENAELVISKSNYDLSSITFSSTESYPAVTYKHIKDYFSPSDNFSYTCWFNLISFKESILGTNHLVIYLSSK